MGYTLVINKVTCCDIHIFYDFIVILGALVLRPRYYYYYSTLPIQINCTGSEKTWLDCQQINTNCINSRDAQIACQPLQGKCICAVYLHYSNFI